MVRIAPSFGGINLEDISAPRCFEIEDRLRARLDIPVFHDDQHGTAIVVLAALRNAARLTGRKLGDLRVVVSGAGAAGVAVHQDPARRRDRRHRGGRLPRHLHTGRTDLTPIKRQLAGDTNLAGHTGSLVEALAGADVFLGLSAGSVPEPAIASMAPKSIVFSLANPDPEMHPDARRGTRRSSPPAAATSRTRSTTCWPSPASSAGAFDARATSITERMKLAAADALADVVADELRPDLVVPSPFDERVAPAVAAAVAGAAGETASR